MVTSPRLVAILGAESSGKTTLAQALARHFDSPWVPEYLRTFTQLQGRTPQRQEQHSILQTQVANEDAALERAQQNGSAWVFCDTAPLLTAVYSELVFGDRSLYKVAASWHPRYAQTLLLNNDVPWQADGLQRDGAHVRGPVLALLQQHLTAYHAPFALIAGQGPQRMAHALATLCPESQTG